MNKQVALKLKELADEVAHRFSDKNRTKNVNQETFVVQSIVPLSEVSAAVIYIKSTEKKAVAFFYYLNNQIGEWRYFFPKESHLFGLTRVQEILKGIEEHNFGVNFQKPLVSDFV